VRSFIYRCFMQLKFAVRIIAYDVSLQIAYTRNSMWTRVEELGREKKHRSIKDMQSAAYFSGRLSEQLLFFKHNY
jgi:hypothetical protein